MRPRAVAARAKPTTNVQARSRPGRSGFGSGSMAVGTAQSPGMTVLVTVFG
jgi:hypothetical protein